MPQDIRSKEKEVDPVSHFNKNPSVVTLKKKRPNLKENVISERSGAAQSSHHPYSPSPNKPLPFSRYHKRTSTCSVAANGSNPFPTLLCFPRPPDLYCSLLLSEHLPTNKKRAKSTATVERGGQHTGGQEAFHCRLFRRVVFSGGWFISGQRGEARRLLYETNTASDAA